VSNLVAEILLRLVKPTAAGLLGLVLYLIATAVGGEPGSVALLLLCWVSGAAFILLIQESPL
jgi:hypothetical protein